MSIDALSDFTITSRYARYIQELKRRETWEEAVGRVKTMHIRRFPLLREEIEQAFAFVYHKKVLPAMRSMQFGGRPIEKTNARMYNCTSTYIDRVRAFQEAFWLLLCGSGVGFSVQTHHIEKLPKFHDNLRYTGTDGGPREKVQRTLKTHVVEDSIEGWANALGALLATYMPHPEYPGYEDYTLVFDYSNIRPEGSPLSNGMGKAPGSAPLAKALDKINQLLISCVDRGQEALRPIDAYDIIMHASDAVLSGGVRRSATICLFSIDDEEMVKAKTGDWFITNPQRGRSNNSAVLLRDATTWEQFKALIDSVRQFGEPGFFWSDSTEQSTNPCVEIGLYPVCEQTQETGWQKCNLVEINGKAINSRSDFYFAVKAATFISTLQASYTNFDYLGETTERIVEREALLGVSTTGWMDSPSILFDEETQQVAAEIAKQVNLETAEKIGIKPAARITCVKPSGTTSCVLGTASGIHPHHSKRYFRRVQCNRNDPVLKHFKKYNPSAVEPSVWSANGTDEVITFLIEAPEDAKTKHDVTALQLLEYVRKTQQNWVVNGKNEDLCVQPWLSHNVSNTINVDEDEWDDVARFIYDNRDSFAGVSLLANSGDLDYPQAPFQSVYTPDEIIEEYGVELARGYGLVLDAIDAFGDLWKASSCVLGLGEMLPMDDGVAPPEIARKTDWCERVRQFSRVYMDGDIKRVTHYLKCVWAWDQWCRLESKYTEVDYTTLVEEEDQTAFIQEAACAGGACSI